MGRRRLSGVLLDTHIWAWSLVRPGALSGKVAAAITSAETVCISTISFFEICQKVRLGKWDEMAPYVDRLIALADEQRVSAIPVSSEISIAAATLEWSHRDPFDRLICATAMSEGLTLISADSAFDNPSIAAALPGRVR
jgi:PIN domain nuclease of toxin-antitoxin system